MELEAVYDEFLCTTPLFLILTPGLDPTRQMQWNAISLGQGQEPKATSVQLAGARQGFWAFMANCHICVPWLPGLEKLIERVVEEQPHEHFSIFLSSSPTPKLPIQLLQTCIKMASEPLKGLKANLVRLLMNMTDEQDNRVREQQKYRRFFFSLCWFHAVLLERKKFKMLGWNIAYDFNDSDIEVWENILAMYLDAPLVASWICGRRLAVS